MSESSKPGEHEGSLGLAQGTALYIASVLGTGILVLPGIAAGAAGPASLISVVAVFILSIPLAGTFAALAARFPDPGGVASYARTALGDTVARIAGYLFYFGVSAGAPIVGVLGAEYVVAVLGVDRAIIPWLTIVMIAIPFTLNLFGVKVSGSAQMGLTALLMIVVVGVVALGFPAVQQENFSPFMPHGWIGVGTAISLFVWAFAGWEVGTHIAGEFKNPRRVIPLATAIAAIVVGIAYIALQWVTIGVLGDKAGEGAVPLLSLVNQTAPRWGAIAVAIVAAIVSVGVMNAYFPAFGKLGAALGRDGDLPTWFAKGADANTIPRRSLMVVLALASIYFTVLWFQDFYLGNLILLHTSSMVAIYVIGMIAAVKILDTYTLGWWMAVVASVLSIGLFILAGANMGVPLFLAVIAIIITFVKRRRAQKRSS